MVGVVHRKNSRAQSVIEFALVLPFLILLLAGAIDFANAFRLDVALSNAAREGAAWAISDNSSTNTCDRVTEALNGTDLSVSCSRTYPGGPPGCAANTRLVGCPVRVTVTANAPTYFAGIVGLSTIPLTAVVNMVVLSL